MRAFSPLFVGAVAAAWGALVWLNWFDANPVSLRDLGAAAAVWGKVRPLPALGAAASHSKMIALLVMLGFAAAGAGAPLRRFLRGRHRGANGAVALALGAGVLGLATLGLGFCGLLFRSVAWTAVLAGVGACVLRHEVSSVKSEVSRACSLILETSDFRLVSFGLTFAILLAVLLGLVGALAPEASFDGQSHHLAHPALYAAHHKVHAVPYHFLANYPALLEMQYLLAMLLSGAPELAKLVHFSWGLLVAAVVFAWTRERAGERWALAAAAGFLLLPYVHLVLMWAYVDFGAAGYLTLALWAAAGRWGSPALLGVLSALGAGTKVSGVFAPLLVAALLVRGRAPRRAWFAFLAAFVLAASPWGVKNLGFTGNPVAPFLPGTFPTLNWGPENLERYAEELGSYESGHVALKGWPGAVARPWDMSVHNTGVLDTMGGMGGWFLFLFPLAALAGSRASRPLILLALGYFALWQFIPRQVRYLLPAWPVAAVACAAVARDLAARGALARAVVAAAGFVLAVHLLLAFQRQYLVIHPVRVVFGLETPDEYLGRGMPGKAHSVRARDWLARQAGWGRTLVLNQYGLGLFWGPRAIVQSFFDTPLFELYARQARTPAGIGKKLRQAGVDAALYDHEGGFYMQNSYDIFHFGPDEARRWKEYWTTRARLARREGGQYLIYRLDSSAAPRPGDEPVAVWPGLEEQWLAPLDDIYLAATSRGDKTGAVLNTVEGYAKVAAETGSPAAWERLGVALLAMGQGKRSGDALMESERRGRRTAKLNDAAGVIHLNAGDFTRAAGRFRRAIDLDPEWERAYRGLAMALAALGDRAAAVEVLRRGLAACPGSAEMRALLDLHSR